MLTPPKPLDLTEVPMPCDAHDRGATRRKLARALRRPAAVIVLSTALLASPAAAVADPVVAAAGDIACTTAPILSGSSCHYGKTADLIDNAPAATDVLALGDIQYECADYPLFLTRYDKTWGVFKSITRATLGNHEYYVAGTNSGCDPGTTAPTQGYFDYFNGQGVQTGPAGERGKGYYSYNVGSWHVIVLNSNCSKVSCAASSAQALWLKNDLAANPQSCSIAAFHHPRFASGAEASASTQPLWQVLYDAGVDVALTGHQHFYERFDDLGRLATAADKYEPTIAQNGIREFVVGTGGRNHQSFKTIRTGSQSRNSTAFGVLKLTLHPGSPGSYDWAFVPESGATFTDTGSGTCVTSRGPDTTAPAAPTNLTAAASSGAVDLTWTAPPDPDVAKYQVYRGPAGGTRTRIASSVTATSFHDTTVAAATSYDYTVRAVDSNGNVSPDSNKMTVTTPGGTTLTFSPIADAYVDQANPTANFGTATTLKTDSGTPVVQSFLRFDVSGITGKTVQKATLRLYVTNGAPDGPPMHVVTDTSWTETGITWNNQPPLGTLLSDVGALTASTFVDYDVTAALAGKADGEYSIGIAQTPTTDGVDFRSREATSNGPKLTVALG
jgi:hypothetical protein